MGLAGLLATPLNAQEGRIIKFVVPFAAGGSTDVIARIIAEYSGRHLGRTIIVENKPGAGTVLGSQDVARAEPDGSTYLFATSAYAIAQVLQEKLPFNPERDLAPIMHVATVPMVLMTHPKLPVKSVPELLSYLRANPGKVGYGSAGVGSALHTAGELFRYVTKTDLVHVPYRGAGPAMNDALAGVFELFIDSVATAAPHIQNGSLRALAVTAAQRSSALPEVPTAAEVGLAGFETVLWNVIMARRGTPDSETAKLRDGVERALASPELTARFKQIGAEVVRASTAEQVRTMIQAEIDKWRPVVAANGIPVH
jgi:tripartite-type tricarboxylate transporter receptor subunit TctC